MESRILQQDELPEILYAKFRAARISTKSTGSKVPDIWWYEYNQLTEKEKIIVKNIFLGKSNIEIAQSLTISPETVKRHVYNIFQKARAKNRTELVFTILTG